MVDVSISFRVDFSPECAVGPGKIALLEHIGSTGSLSEAARRLKMSYRRAWLLLEDLNTSFQQPVARMSVGGRGGGGASLTPIRRGAGCRLPQPRGPHPQTGPDCIPTRSPSGDQRGPDAQGVAQAQDQPQALDRRLTADVAGPTNG